MRIAKAKSYTRLLKRVNKISQLIAEGAIDLPDPGEGNVWSLAGSGSNIHIAVHAKQFPGARLDPHSNGATYLTATNEPFEDKGTFLAPFRTENYHERKIVFNNGDVSMPITSLRLWAKDGHRNILDHDSGEFIHRATNEVDPL